MNAVLLQLPTEDRDEKEAIRETAPERDVDCLPLNMGRLAGGAPLCSCPLEVMEFLRAHDILARGKDGLVLGRSSIVGRPMHGRLLSQAGGTVTLCRSHTENLAEYTRRRGPYDLCYTDAERAEGGPGPHRQIAVRAAL